MAAAVAHRAVQNPHSVIPRLSFSFLRNLSAASPSTQNPTASASAADKPKRRKKKNLFEVAQFLPNWGIGYHMAKSHWTNVSYQITKMNLYKDGKHGKAWGIAHKDGLPAADAPKKISGVHKRCWRYIPSKTADTTPNLMKLTVNSAETEAQAA